MRLFLGADELARRRAPRRRSATFEPSCAGTPFKVTRPASIHLSASRREHTPVSLMNLFNLTTRSGSSAQEPRQLLRQGFRIGIE